MSRQLTYDIIADGGTDRALIPVLNWAIHQVDPHVDILEPTFRKRQGSVAEFLQEYKSEAMIIFFHRDAEAISLAARQEEFTEIERQDVVPVIPVRMSEAWLLIDGNAIANAADHRRATVTLPNLNKLESIQDGQFYPSLHGGRSV